MDKTKKLTTVFVVALFSSLLAGLQSVRLAEANFLPPIEHHLGVYIKSDGSVSPASSPIQRAGNVYTLTGAVTIGIGIERSNVVVNGNGYALQGNGSGTAFHLKSVENVTIQNVNVQGFSRGFYLNDCRWCTITRNEISSCGTGIWVTQESCYNKILENTMESTGISNSFADHNLIAENEVRGLSVTWSNNVTLENNYVASNTSTGESGDPFEGQSYGVYLDNSNHCKLYNNSIERNRYGIHFWHCENFTLSGNVLRDNDCGIQFEASSFIENRIHWIDTSNTVNGKPVYYLVNEQNVQVPSDAGWVAAISCTNITVQNVTPAPNGEGILFAYTSDSRIVDSTLAKNFNAIMLDTSSNCTIARNLLCDSGYAAIYFEETVDCTVTENVIVDNFCIFGVRHGSAGNMLFRNNFIDNGWIGAFDHDCQNLWDNGSEGNYWSSYDERASYAGVDADGDGIGDTPYIVDDYSGNEDRYPLMERVDIPAVLPEFSTWTVLVAGFFVVTVVSIAYRIGFKKGAPSR